MARLGRVIKFKCTEKLEEFIQSVINMHWVKVGIAFVTDSLQLNDSCTTSRTFLGENKSISNLDLVV
jgi:hypothetical protein